MSREAAAQALRGAAWVSLYSENSPSRPIDGDAYKSYGLWIDGQLIRSVESALERDGMYLHLVFPLIGVGCLAMALLVRIGARRAALAAGDEKR